MLGCCYSVLFPVLPTVLPGVTPPDLVVDDSYLADACTLLRTYMTINIVLQAVLCCIRLAT